MTGMPKNKYDIARNAMLQTGSLVVSVLLCGGVIPPKTISPLRVSVCQLVSLPKAYAMRRVEVFGQVVGGFHGLALTNKGCSDKSLSLMIDNVVSNRTDVSRLMKIIYKEGNAGTTGKNVMATFVGVFIYSHLSRPDRELKVEHVENVNWRSPTNRCRGRDAHY
jgi:hypothetical protein